MTSMTIFRFGVSMKNIRPIQYLILGHPDSLMAGNKAIDLAMTHQARHTSVQVLDVAFSGTAIPVMASFEIIFDQLRELGMFTKSLLSEQAKQPGGREVDFFIHEGNIPQTIRIDLRAPSGHLGPGSSYLEGETCIFSYAVTNQ